MSDGDKRAATRGGSSRVAEHVEFRGARRSQVGRDRCVLIGRQGHTVGAQYEVLGGRGNIDRRHTHVVGAGGCVQSHRLTELVVDQGRHPCGAARLLQPDIDREIRHTVDNGDRRLIRSSAGVPDAVDLNRVGQGARGRRSVTDGVHDVDVAGGQVQGLRAKHGGVRTGQLHRRGQRSSGDGDRSGRVRIGRIGDDLGRARVDIDPRGVSHVAHDHPGIARGGWGGGVGEHVERRGALRVEIGRDGGVLIGGQRDRGRGHCGHRCGSRLDGQGIGARWQRLRCTDLAEGKSRQVRVNVAVHVDIDWYAVRPGDSVDDGDGGIGGCWYCGTGGYRCGCGRR